MKKLFIRLFTFGVFLLPVTITIACNTEIDSDQQAAIDEMAELYNKVKSKYNEINLMLEPLWNELEKETFAQYNIFKTVVKTWKEGLDNLNKRSVEEFKQEAVNLLI